jgi:hypothetical protein
MSAWNFNLGGRTAEEIDKLASKPPDGYYVAIFSKLEDDTETLAQKFEFKIDSGLHVGVILRGKLNNPAMADDPKKAEGMVKKALIWAARLGIIDKGAKGDVTVNFAAALGKKYVVKVKSSTFTRSDGTTSDPYQEIDYAGIYPLDHADIDGPTRVELGLPLLPGQSATPAVKGKGRAAAAAVVPGAASGAPATAPTQSADAIANSLLN